MISTMVGNYPKVAEGAYGTNVIGSISRWQRGELDERGLEDVFRDVTRAVIKEQEEAGLELITDGQIRWEDLVTPIARRLEGFEINGLTRWFNNNVYYRKPILHKAPVRRGPILVEEYKFARSVAKRPVKAVLPGPYTFAKLSEDQHYRRERPLVLKLAELLNEEARALVEAGASFVQFDEPALGFGKPDMKLAIEGLNVAASGLKATRAVYTYFGSLNGALPALMKAHVEVIGVDPVSDGKLLPALRKTKITKALAVGCLDGRNTKLESVKDLHALFDALARLVPADQLYVNPSCGLEFLPHAQARAKLQRLGEAVRTYSRKARRR